MPLCGILTSFISWKAAFYFYGVMGIVWYTFWLWLTFEKPRNHPAISLQELKYIEKSLGESVKLQMPTIATTPWHEISRSMPVYAIIVANFCRSWNFYLLVLYQSKYLKHKFDFQVAEVRIIMKLWNSDFNVWKFRLVYSVHCHICWWLLLSHLAECWLIICAKMALWQQQMFENCSIVVDLASKDSSSYSSPMHQLR